VNIRDNPGLAQVLADSAVMKALLGANSAWRRTGLGPTPGRLANVQSSRVMVLGWAMFFAAAFLPACQRLPVEQEELALPKIVDGFEPEWGVNEVKYMLKRHSGESSRVSKSPNGQARVESQSLNPWASPDACQALVSSGQRLKHAPDKARFATWNIRWFPDGVAGRASAPAQGTDLNWLACVIAWLDVDVLALQEVKADALSRTKLESVVAELQGKTGGSWSVALDQCPAHNGQHVAFLYASHKVKTSPFVQYAALNPRASACADQLRPGLGSTFTFPGGLDIHAITVHLKSGVTERDIDLRRRSWAALTDVIATEVKESKDSDVIVLGDFNSMGCHSCELPYGNQQELSELDRQLRIGESPARRVGADFPCSQYFQQQPGLLDHVVITEATRELSPTVRAQVEGYCQNLECESFTGKEPLALRRLSDHCPLVVELTDRDLD